MAGLQAVRECKKALDESTREFAKAHRKEVKIKGDIDAANKRLRSAHSNNSTVALLIQRLSMKLKEAARERESWERENGLRKAALVDAGFNW